MWAGAAAETQAPPTPDEAPQVQLEPRLQAMEKTLAKIVGLLETDRPQTDHVDAKMNAVAQDVVPLVI